MPSLPHNAIWIAPDNAGRTLTRLASDHVDTLIARLAVRQAGVVARRQLLALGLRPDQIDARVASGHLHPIHPGVYACGQRALAPVARFWAAVLACGDGALLTGWSAAHLLGALPDRRTRPVVVTLADGRRAMPAGVVTRRLALRPSEQTQSGGLRCTTPARSVFDIAAADGAAAAERAWRGFVHERRLDLEAVGAILEHHDGERGIRVVRALYDRRAAILGRSESMLEERVARFVAQAGFPAEPLRNSRFVLSDRRVVRFDLCFPDLRLAIEADGPYHDDPEVQADDAARDASAARDGWQTVRVSHRETAEAAVHRLARVRQAAFEEPRAA